jgi:hypothetical protein
LSFYTLGYINETLGAEIEFTDVLDALENKALGEWTIESTYAVLNGQLRN